MTSFARCCGSVPRTILELFFRARYTLVMTQERKRLLDRRLREAIGQQPEIEILAELLLDLGGIQLVAPPKADPAVALLVDAGVVMARPVHCQAMEDGKCHQNVARLWRQKRHEVLGIGTGYALSDDGLWRQHSWGIRREGILETTSLRAKYFGLLLQGVDADSFAESNCASASRNGHSRRKQAKRIFPSRASNIGGPSWPKTSGGTRRISASLSSLAGGRV